MTTKKKKAVDAIATPEVQLQAIVPVFIENRDVESKAKKLKEKASATIRALLPKMTDKTFELDDIKVYLSETTSNVIDGEKLLELVKDAGVSGIVKTREYVDMDELDAAIARGEIDANLKLKATSRKTSERLLVGKV